MTGPARDRPVPKHLSRDPRGPGRGGKVEPAVHGRLVTYGTLSPGQPNHQHMAGMVGRWFPGSVRGWLFQSGWGAALGYPGIVLDESAEEVPVWVFESDDLESNWPRLDEFEGEGYQRVACQVLTEGGLLEAFLYELAPSASGNQGSGAS